MSQCCFVKAQILMAILAVFNIWIFFINRFWEGHFIFKQNGEWLIFCEKGASFLVGRTPHGGICFDGGGFQKKLWSGVYHKNNYTSEKVH